MAGPPASRRRSAPSPDSYVSVFFEAEQRRRLWEVIDAAGASRDLAWISIDPLVPMGTRATHAAP